MLSMFWVPNECVLDEDKWDVNESSSDDEDIRRDGYLTFLCKYLHIVHFAMCFHGLYFYKTSSYINILIFDFQFPIEISKKW